MTGRTAKWKSGRIALISTLAGMLLATGVFFGMDLLRSPEPPGPAPEPVERVDAELVHFAQGTEDLPRIETVLRSPADAVAFSGWFPEDGDDGQDLARKLARRDFSRHSLVAFGWSSGCSKGKSAELVASDDPTNYYPRLTDTSTTETCYAPWNAIAVFAVPKTWVASDTVHLSGGPPEPPGPARLHAFEHLKGAQQPKAMEVTQPDQLKDFLGTLPAPAADQLKRELTISAEEDTTETAASGPARRFAFIHHGCGSSAVLRVTADRLQPQPTGEVLGEDCTQPRPYAAIFAVSATQVPPEARLTAGD
ncbi:hypothetical protein [Streptomyces boninensis]|uniref:hypothetical protein n=1 Tax=Streptomyces boninensis TaxID=2039455 RepID=UPI003B22429B